MFYLDVAREGRWRCAGSHQHILILVSEAAFLYHIIHLFHMWKMSATSLVTSLSITSYLYLKEENNIFEYMDNTGKFWGLHKVSFFSDSCNNSGHTMSLWRNAEVERFICGWGQCVLKLFTLCADLCGTAVRVCLCTSCRKFYKDTGNPRVLLWCAPASLLGICISSHMRHKETGNPRVLL